MSIADDIIAANLTWWEQAEQMPRQEFLLAMSPSCWHDDCQDCPGIRCACACHDEPPFRPEPPRCRRCRYLTSAPGHKIMCGDES